MEENAGATQSSAPPSISRRLTAHERRARITEAAVRLLKERSFGDVTVEMLREEAGLSKGGLYHHVRSKTDVLLMVCDAAGEAMLESLRAAQSIQGSGRDRVEYLLGAHFDLVFEYGGALWAFLAERQDLPEADRERILAWEREMVRGVKSLLDELVASGELRAMDTRVLSHTLLGMVNWVPRWYRGAPDLAAVKQTLAALFFEGVAKPGRSSAAAPPLSDSTGEKLPSGNCP